MLFLIRHADALDGDIDAERPLSPKGLKQVRHLARFLKESASVEVREVWHSPLVRARETAAERWAGRFADLLDEDPSVEAELRALVDEVAARLPTGAVSAADHSVAAGRDVNVTASGGGIAAGVIHGNVTPPDPTPPGPAQR